jgi:hypothetical protein
MPPTVVHAALGALLAVALLRRYDRRSVAVCALAAAVPDLDAPLSVLVSGAHGAVLHTLFVPVGLWLAVRWDAAREDPVLARLGSDAVGLARVAVLVYALAGIAPDLFNLTGANPVWPLDTLYYSVVGTLEYSTTRGLVQTFYEYRPGGRFVHHVGQRGRPPRYCNPSAWSPTCGASGDDSAERVVPLVQSGWQTLLVLASVVAVAARDRLERGGTG